MSYATPADLLERFEADLVAQRAAPEGLRVSGTLLRFTLDGGSDPLVTPEETAAAEAAIARIESVLLDATGFIDSFLSDLYVLPLNPVPRLIKRLCCDVARFYLWGDAAVKDSVEERDFKSAQKTLEGIRKGEVKLGVQPEAVSTPDRIVGEVLGGGERLFTRHSLRGL